MTPLGAAPRVLAVIVARIGDTLLATPALRALRGISGHLEVLAHPKRREVLQHLEFIDELGSITKGWAWLRGLGLVRRRRYDVAICYGRDPELLEFCVRAAARVIVFDHPELRGIGGEVVLRVPVPADSSMHAVKERLLLAEAAGAHTGDLRLAYIVTPQESLQMSAWLDHELGNGAGKARQLVGLQPLSFPTKAHRDWPPERFVALSRKITEIYPRSHIVVLGDAGAQQLAPVFKAALGERCTIAAGQLSLRQSAALIDKLALYVGVDTGPTHIAGALRVPMVALYHAAYAGRYLMPMNHPRCTAIEHPMTLSAGGRDASMGSISLEQVWQAAHGLLGESA